MQTIQVIFAVVLSLALLAPVSSQQQGTKDSAQPTTTTGAPPKPQVEPKGIEGPNIRKQERGGIVGSDARQTRKRVPTSKAPPKPRVEPRDSEAPGLRRQDLKGTDGPDVRQRPRGKKALADTQAPAPRGIEGPEVRKQEPKREEGPDIRVKPQ